MKKSLRFLVNDRVVETEAWAGSPLLDFLRQELGLTGTKEGCREGDCGACAVLVGERIASSESGAVLVGDKLLEGTVRYRAMPSCLLALGELEGCHLLTIEGLASAAEVVRGGATAGAQLPRPLGPVMNAFLEENASQCGFCSPGFIVSLTAWLMEGERLDEEGALVAVEGNLCRCTGYASIRRAASRLLREFPNLPGSALARFDALVAARVLPPSVAAFARGELLPPEPAGVADSLPVGSSGAPLSLVLGGGTDFYVKNTDPEPREGLLLADREPRLKGIRALPSGELELGAALTIRDFFASEEVLSRLPGIEAFEGRFASILIRNRATLGGNIANASPVADMTSMLIALGARLRIERPGSPEPPRETSLERFFLGYKKLDLAEGEIIAAILLPALPSPILFNFEKASKRASLDIAAVNTSLLLELEGDRILHGRLAAGGVAATPLLLERSSAFLAGRPVSAETAFELSRIACSEVEPIGDVRGSAGYRRRVLGRLVLAHFAALFPSLAAEIADIAELAEAPAPGGSETLPKEAP